MCAAAVTTVRRVAEAAHSARMAEDDERKVLKEAEVEAMLTAVLGANGADVAGDPLMGVAVSYCAAIATVMVNKKNTDPAKWQDKVCAALQGRGASGSE